jgi:hypothetical protein
MSVLDMFRRQYFNIREQVCASYTSADGSAGGKGMSGLQLSQHYLLVKAAKIVIGFNLVNNDIIKANETAAFLDVLHFSKDTLIGGAINNTNKNRNTKLHRVANLRQSTDLNKLKSSMCSRVKQ